MKRLLQCSSPEIGRAVSVPDPPFVSGYCKTPLSPAGLALALFLCSGQLFLGVLPVLT